MPGNIAQLFVEHLAQPERILYRHCVDGIWTDVSACAIGAQPGRRQTALRRTTLGPGDRIPPCARNGVDWILSR